MPKNEFRTWLEAQGLNYFAFAVVTGIDFNTVAKWGSNPDRVPRDYLKEKIAAKYPDCPLIRA